MKDTNNDYMDDMEDAENKRPKKRRRWPFLLLGFFLGFLTTIGTLVLTVFLVINNPIKKTVGTIDNVTNAGLYEALFGNGEDLGILDASYGDKSLKDAITEISNVAQKGDSLTFADLNAISPQVEKTLDNLIEMANKKSIVLDKDELLFTPLNKFSDLLMDEVKAIELGNVLLATKPDVFDDPATGAILKNLLFGKFGVNYTEVNGEIEMLPITYTYNSNTDTFVCVDDTVYYKNGNVWKEENGQYISNIGEKFVLHSADNKEIHQLQNNATRQTSTYTAITMVDNQPQPVKQQALVLGAFMDKNNDPMAVIGQLELGTLLGITTKKDVEANDILLVTLAYGTYGVDFEYDGNGENSKIIPKKGGNPFTTVESLMDLNNAENLLRDLPLSEIFGVDIFDEDADSLTISLIYGTEGTHYNIIRPENGEPYIEWLIKNEATGEKYKERTFGELRNADLTEIVDKLKVGDVLGLMDEESPSKLLLAIKDWYISDLKDSENIKNLRFNQVIDISSDDELLSTIGTWKIGEISTEKFNSIELRQIFDVEDDNGFLYTLVNKTTSEGNVWTLGDLTSENINSLTINEVLGDVSDNFYLKHLSDSTLKTLSDDINALTVIKLFEDAIDYKTDAQGNIVYENGHPVLKGTWKYLLSYNPDNANSYPYTAPEDYAVTDMSKLIENMHNNIENATLHELHDDGVIPHLGEDGNHTLNQKLLPAALASKANEISSLLGLSASQNITIMTIGDLTVLQVSDYLGFLLGEILNPSV